MVRTPDWLLERRKRAERALATAREILGIGVTTAEDGAAWLTFLRSLTAGGLSGVRLITSDAHAGLINAIGASLPGASWQRCRIHYATNVMAVTPTSAWPGVRTLLHSVHGQPDSDSVAANMIGSSTLSPTSSPRSLIIWKQAVRICWRSPRSPNRSGARSGRTTPRNDSPRRSAVAPNEGDTGKAQCLGLSLRFVILARQFSHPKEARRFSRGLSFARLPESWQPVPCVDVDVEHERLVALAVRVCA